jgi:hypothetical protein
LALHTPDDRSAVAATASAEMWADFLGHEACCARFHHGLQDRFTGDTDLHTTLPRHRGMDCRYAAAAADAAEVALRAWSPPSTPDCRPPEHLLSCAGACQVQTTLVWLPARMVASPAVHVAANTPCHPLLRTGRGVRLCSVALQPMHERCSLPLHEHLIKLWVCRVPAAEAIHIHITHGPYVVRASPYLTLSGLMHARQIGGNQTLIQRAAQRASRCVRAFHCLGHVSRTSNA